MIEVNDKIKNMFFVFRHEFHRLTFSLKEQTPHQVVNKITAANNTSPVLQPSIGPT